jgi:hypothetical protein
MLTTYNKDNTTWDFAAPHVCNSAGENNRKHLRVNALIVISEFRVQKLKSGLKDRG